MVAGICGRGNSPEVSWERLGCCDGGQRTVGQARTVVD